MEDKMSELREKIADIMWNDAINTKKDIKIGDTASNIINAVADVVEKNVYLTVNDTEYEVAFFDAIRQVVRDLRAQAEDKGQEAGNDLH